LPADVLESSQQEPHPASMVFPSELWEDYNFEEVFPPEKIRMPDGQVQDLFQDWKMCEKREVPIKNMGELEVREIIKTSLWYPSASAEERAKENMEKLKKQGLYHGQT
jgi:hypothetical protein